MRRFLAAPLALGVPLPLGRPVLLGATLLLGAGCRGTLSPLSHRIEVGAESYVVFVADGEDGAGDLFAAKPGGGDAWQITFSRVDERLPALSPDGVMLAFDRGHAPGDTAVRRVVVMNLLNGNEREVTAPGAVRPEAIAWSADGRRLVIRQGPEVLAVPAPPERGGLVPADSADRLRLAVRAGDAMKAEARTCATGTGVCVVLPDGREVALDPEADSPASWFGDSVAYRRAGAWVIHPLAGGHTRALRLPARLGNPRMLTLFRAPR